MVLKIAGNPVFFRTWVRTKNCPLFRWVQNGDRHRTLAR